MLKNKYLEKGAPYATGSFLVLVGAIVIFGWMTNNVRLIQLHSSFVGMQFNTALTLILTGLGLIFLVLKSSKLSWLFSFLGFSIAFTTLFEYVFAIEPGIDQLFCKYNLNLKMIYPGRMAASTAFCFSIGNIVLFLLNLKKNDLAIFIAQILSCLVIGITGVNLLGYLSGLDVNVEWLPTYWMAIHTSISGLFFGLAIFYLSLIQPITSSLSNFSIPIATTVFLGTGAMATNQLFDIQEQLSIWKISQKNSEILTNQLKNNIYEIINAIERMAARIEGLPAYTKELFEIDAKNYLNDLTGLDTIQLLNPNLKTINEFNNELINRTPFLDVFFKNPFLKEENKHIAFLSSDDKNHLIILRSLYTNHVSSGFLLAAVDVIRLLESAIYGFGFGNYLVLLKCDETIIDTAGNIKAESIGYPIVSSIDPKIGRWEIEMWITNNVALPIINTTVLISAVGFVVSVLGGLLIYFWQQLKVKQKILAEKNLALASATQKAEEATIAKSTFLATMSHEIRTPLNAITGTIQLLQETEDPSNQKRYFDRIFRASQVLLKLISDILDFSKIEAGGVVLQPIDSNLEALVKGVSDVLFLKAQEKNVIVLVDFPTKPLPKILIDPIRFQQILSNLGNNSLKFTEKGYILIRVIYKEIDLKRVGIRFEVEDTGIGISEEDQKKLFQKFSQVDSSSTQKYGGVGLGLSICKKLVDLMRGNIGVKSKPGMGSTFWFELFLTTTTPPTESYTNISQTIFVQDTIEEEQEILKKYLTSWGATFADSLNGCNLAILSSENEEMIQQAEKQNIPILLIRNKNTTSDSHSGLIRPITPFDLYQAIKKME